MPIGRTLTYVSRSEYLRDAFCLIDEQERAATTTAYSVVVIGGSAGGIPALIQLFAALPADFGLPILVVQHLSAKMPSGLPEVLGWRSPLRVKWAEAGELMKPGTVYVAPPDRHLLIGPGSRIVLSSAERIDWWRPAVDALFLSAATVCGERTIAVVLSGVMWDGSKGMAAVARAGGITIAQDDVTSGHFDMPASALDFGGADLMMRPVEIARALQVLANPPF